MSATKSPTIESRSTRHSPRKDQTSEMRQTECLDWNCSLVLNERLIQASEYLQSVIRYSISSLQVHELIPAICIRNFTTIVKDLCWLHALQGEGGNCRSMTEGCMHAVPVPKPVPTRH